MHYFFLFSFFLIWMDENKFFPTACIGAFKIRKEKKKRKQEKNMNS